MISRNGLLLLLLLLNPALADAGEAARIAGFTPRLSSDPNQTLTKLMGALRQYLMERGRKEELSPFFEKKGETLLKALQKKDWKGVEGLLKESFGMISLEEFEIR